jgi:heptosyltransferase I
VHGMQVLLCGAPDRSEREMGAAIMRHARRQLTNRIGADNLPQLLALLSRATVLLSPDSGPVHMATMVSTPVIGLYAATNPARTGPYFSRNWCVDAYGQAARRFRGRSPDLLAWTTKIEVPGVMDLIAVPQVTAKLDALVGSLR